MRYIDADKLIDDIRPFAEYDSNRSNKDWVRRFEIAIDAQPTADVRENIQLDVCPLYGGACGYPSGECYDCPRHGNFRENVKGRWVEVVDRTEMYDKEGVKTWGMLFQCNQCGFVLNAIEGHTGQYNYCPNCGADMRRES